MKEEHGSDIEGLGDFDLWGQFKSLLTGIAPFVVASSIMVSNLNADKLDGMHASDLVPVTRQVIAGTGLTGGGALTADVTLTLNDSYVQGVVRNTPLTGYAAGSNVAITASDSVLAAFGKVQAQLNGITSGYVPASRTITVAGTAGQITSSAGAQSLALDRTWTLALATAGTAGTYRSVTTDSYGRVTAGTNPTTVSGYGITDILAQTLAGYAVGSNTALTSSNTILTAFQNVQGQLNNRHGGSVTTNYIPKATGSFTFGNSVMQEVSSMIGINVTPSNFPLQVAHTWDKTDTSSRNLLFFGSNESTFPAGVIFQGTGGATQSVRKIYFGTVENNVTWGGTLNLQPYAGSVVIGSTNTGAYTFDLYGDFNLRSGAALRMNGSAGTNGQYLKTSGTGASWANVTVDIADVTGLSTTYVRKATADTISAAHNFTSTSLQMPGHYFHNLYTGGANAYVHFYGTSGNGATNSFANLRVWNGTAGALKVLTFGGDGTFTWDGQPVHTGSVTTNYIPKATGSGTFAASIMSESGGTTISILDGKLRSVAGGFVISNNSATPILIFRPKGDTDQTNQMYLNSSSGAEGFTMYYGIAGTTRKSAMGYNPSSILTNFTGATAYGGSFALARDSDGTYTSSIFTFSGGSGDGNAKLGFASQYGFEFWTNGGANIRFNNLGQIVSTIATGNSPFTVSSTTAVTNLNADMVDGLHASSFVQTSRTVTINGTSGRITSSAGTQALSSNVSVTLDLATTGVSAGTYTKLTVDAYGRATGGTSLSSGDVTGALGYTPINPSGETWQAVLTRGAIATTRPVIKAGATGGGIEFLRMEPTDFSTGKHYLSFSADNPGIWNIYAYDNTTYGTVNFIGTVQNNGVALVTASSTNTFTNKSGNISQWTNNSGYITSATVNTQYSLTGGGSVGNTTITLSLVNDQSSPGNNYYYGTNSSGAKGWYTLTSSGGSDTWQDVLARGSVATTKPVIKAGPSAGGYEFFRLEPTDYGTNKPLLQFVADSTIWHINAFDGSNYHTVNINGTFTIGNAPVMTASSSNYLTNKSGNISMWTNDSNYATQSYVTSQGYITASSSNTLTNKSGNISMWTNNSGYITSATVNTQYSLTGGGSVAGTSITLNLVNDQNSPGNNMLYGTNGSGTKGWYAQPSGGGGISGSGTSGKFAIWTGSGSIGDSGLQLISGTYLFGSDLQTIGYLSTYYIRTSGYSTSSINALSSPGAGILVYNNTLNMFVFHDGSGWKRVHDNSAM